MFRKIGQRPETTQQSQFFITICAIIILTYALSITGCADLNIQDTENKTPITIIISSNQTQTKRQKYPQIENPFISIEFQIEPKYADKLDAFISDIFSISFDDKATILAQNVFTRARGKRKYVLDLSQNIVVGREVHEMSISPCSAYIMTVIWDGKKLDNTKTEGNKFEFQYQTTVDTPQNPIYFLPGIMGSIICDGNNSTRWDAAGKYFTSENLLQLHRHNDEDSYTHGSLKTCGIIGIDSQQRVSSEGRLYNVFLNKFEDFSNNLQNPFPYTKMATEMPGKKNARKNNTKYGTITPYAYDWRVSFHDTIEKLHCSLNSTLKDGDPKITLIGHSMGGLIAYFYANDFDPEYKGSQYVKQVVMIASPLSGSIQAGIALRQGVSAIIDSGALPIILGKPISIILTRSFPSLYYLLPHVKFDSDTLSRQIRGANKEKNYMRTLIDDSETYWEAPRNSTRDHKKLAVPTANLISTTKKKHTFGYDTDNLEGLQENGFSSGDGTVSLTSLRGRTGAHTTDKDLGKDEDSSDDKTVTIYNLSKPNDEYREPFHASHTEIISKGKVTPLYYYIKDLLWKNAYNEQKKIPTVEKSKNTQNSTAETVATAPSTAIMQSTPTAQIQHPIAEINGKEKKQHLEIESCTSCLKEDGYQTKILGEHIEVVLKKNGTLGRIANCISTRANQSAWNRMDTLHKSYRLAKYNLSKNKLNFKIGQCTKKRSQNCFKYKNRRYDLSKIEENSTILIPKNYHLLLN